jgi:hypothetical protein
MAITWRTINSPNNFDVAARLMEQARSGLSDGLGAFQGIMEDQRATQDANRLNTIGNNEAELKKMISGATLEDLNSGRLQQQLDGRLAQLGTGGVSRDFDTSAMLRDAVTGRRQDAIAAREFTQGEARALADPRLQEYQALRLSNPKAAEAFLQNEENAAILRNAMMLDDAMLFNDTRGQTELDRRNAAWNQDRRVLEAGRADTEYASKQAIASIMGSLHAQGYTGRNLIDATLERASQADSGVSPMYLPDAAVNARNFGESIAAKTSEEAEKIAQDKREQEAIAVGLQNTLTQKLAATEASIEALPDPLRMDKKDLTLDEVMEELRGYEWADGYEFEWRNPSWKGLWFGDSSTKEFSDMETIANTALKEAGLAGQVHPGRLLVMAAKMAAEGSGDKENPGKLNLAKMRNTIQLAASNLLRDRELYSSLAKDKAKTTGRINYLPQKTAKELREIENQLKRNQREWLRPG